MNIYNNKFFNRLYSKQEISNKRLLEKMGASITEQEKFNQITLNDTKFNFWAITALIILFGYQSIVFIFNFLR